MKIKELLLLISLSLIFLYCAKKGLPPGGPEDKTSPQIISTFPTPDSTRVGQDLQLEIAFSERMDKKKTEESIFVSPLPETPWKYSWHKNKLILKPPKPFSMMTTYVITIGSSAGDVRGNRMKESYSFAFSTGDFIDSCRISGEAQIQGKGEAGISIWAYLLEDEAEANLFKDEPDYVTQTDFQGRYSLQNLRFGKYRLFALKDKNGNLAWDIDEEPMGVTTQDVALDSVFFRIENINFILAPRDTTAPSLVNCRALDRKKIRLDFNESLQKESILNVDNYSIHLLKNSDEKLKLFSVYFQGDNLKSVFLITELMKQDENYEISVSDLRDDFGNEIDSASSSCLFQGTELPDTAGLNILYTQPEDKEINVPLNIDIRIFFSEPPDKKSLESNFRLIGEKEDSVKGKSLWESEVIFTYLPDSLLSSITSYRIELDQVYDLWNNPLSDSVLSINFTTLNKDTLGYVSGEVKLLEEKKGNIVIVLSKIDSDEVKYQRIIEEPGKFLFDMVLPGRYLAKAYIDKDKNNKHDPGEISPFLFAEPYTTFPDTIPVRSRWETEKIELNFE